MDKINHNNTLILFKFVNLIIINTFNPEMLEIKEVRDQKGLKQFVKFPFNLYRGNKHWVPPIIKDELKQLTRESNPFFKNLDAQF